MTKNLAINVTLFSHHPHLDIIQMRGSFFLIWLLLLFQLVVLYPAVVMVWFLNEEHALSWPQALPTSDHCSRVFKKIYFSGLLLKTSCSRSSPIVKIVELTEKMQILVHSTLYFYSEAQCGNYRILVSQFFGKNSVKATVLLNKSLKC